MYSIDLHDLFLDQLQNNKHIIKNQTQLFEKLQMLIITSFTYLIMSIIYLIYTIEIKESSVNSIGQNFIFILIMLHISERSYNMINIIKNYSQNQKNISNKLLYQQVIVSFLLILFNSTIIFIYFHNNNQNQDKISLLIIINIYQSGFMVSNIIKCIHQLYIAIYLLIICIFNYKSIYQTYLSQILFLIVFIVQYIIWTIINQSMSFYDSTEKSARLALFFETIHDIRNYVQSFFEIQDQFKIKSSEDSDVDNQTKSIKESNRYDTSISEQEEFEQQKRFILFRICQLYHIELVFENVYNPKFELIDIKELIKSSSEIIKIILMNKCVSLDIALNSTLASIRLDNKIFDQTLLEIIKILHIQSYDNTLIKINIQYDASNIQLSFSIFLRGQKPIDIILIKEFQRNKIIPKLINNLTKKNVFNYNFNEFDFSIQIQIPQTKRKIKELYKNKYIVNNLEDKVIYENDFQIKKYEKSVKHYQTLLKSSTLFKSYESSIVNINDNDQKVNDSNNIDFQEEIKITIIEQNEYENEIKIDDKTKIFDKIKHKSNEITKIENENEVYDNEIFKEKNEKLNDNQKSSEHNQDIRDQIVQNSPIDKVKNISIKNSDIFNNTKSKKTSIKNDISNNLFTMKIKQQVSFNKIYINLDDEINILRMNSRVFRKRGLYLNCVQNQTGLLNIMMQLYLDSQESSFPFQVIIFIDHQLDNEQGWQAVEKAKKYNQVVKLDLTFVLLSSTEDKETVYKYTSLGVVIQIAKPLNNANLELGLEQAVKDYGNTNIF